jgi:hypothetical protein
MFRLTIRHQLRSGGSQLTLEETQIVENKCIHLQKLIDTFEHQADVFLHHRPVYDFPISTLDDYAEYDNSDDTDDSGVPGPNPQISDAYVHCPPILRDSCCTSSTYIRAGQCVL